MFQVPGEADARGTELRANNILQILQRGQAAECDRVGLVLPAVQSSDLGNIDDFRGVVGFEDTLESVSMNKRTP